MSGGHGGLRKSPPGTTVKEAASEGKEKAAVSNGLKQMSTAFSVNTGCRLSMLRLLIRPGTPGRTFGVPVSGSSTVCRVRAGAAAPHDDTVSGERGLAVGRAGGDVGDGHAELVVLGLKTADLVLKVAYPLLKPSHLRNHTRVGAADVAKQSLRHDVGPPH